MVQANPNAVRYGTWRSDVTPKPGFSKELVSVFTEPKYYDNLGGQPMHIPGGDTMLKLFKRHVRLTPNHPMLGTREELGKDEKGKPSFGEYTWKTFQEVDTNAQAIARGITKLGLSTSCEGDGKTWEFIGIWSKNRREWLETHLSNMYMSRTTIGFFDSMGPPAVDYIMKQTNLACVFVTQEYIAKLTAMKKDGLATSLKSIVCFDQCDQSLITKAFEQGINVHSFADLIAQGKQLTTPFKECGPSDCPIFSYTSGTTGDSKGVKLTHLNLITSAQSLFKKMDFTQEEMLISYLPYPHSFEQVMTAFVCILGCKIGYYSGDPARLTDDCQKVKPTMFPSVPRLYNRIYGILKGKLEQAGGCKTWLANKGIEAKMANLFANSSYTHCCYDKLVFKKICQSLGGEVRFMISASAPIDKNVLDFFKVCFCCPVLEGYGLTETSGGSSLSWPEDPVSGHVGGPLPVNKYRLRDVPEMQYLVTDQPHPRGELQIKGANVFEGYFMRPDKTAESFDEEGWFNTGDVVIANPNGSIKIVDRSKNIFKLSQGEYIAPEKVENVFALSKFAEQTMVYGDSLKNCCVGIIVPNPAAVKEWAAENGKDASNYNALLKMADLKKAIMDELDTLGKAQKLSSLERPRDFYITSEAFSVENDILTPTYKLKRNKGRDAYKTQIDSMYTELAKRGF